MYEEAPIHVASDSHWLDIEQMAAFEESYYQWLTIKIKDSESEEQMQNSYDLITKIQTYEKVDNLSTIQ